MQSTHGCVNRLLPQHLKALKERGLTEETIRAAGIYSEDNSHVIADLLNLGGKPAYGVGDRSCPHSQAAKLGPCQVIPYHHLIDADGKPLDYYRLRPDTPFVDEKRKRERKYEAPRGERIHPYFPRGITALFGNPSIPLIIT